MKIARFLLLGLVVAALGYWAWGRFTPAPPPPAPVAASPAASPPPVPAAPHQVVVTYFTTHVRCASCRTIEDLTRQTVVERFAQPLADGGLVFQTINIDLPENHRFVEAYQLSFKTVVISDQWQGVERSWRKMDEVWQHLGQPARFQEYLAEAIQPLLAAHP